MTTARRPADDVPPANDAPGPRDPAPEPPPAEADEDLEDLADPEPDAPCD